MSTTPTRLAALGSLIGGLAVAGCAGSTPHAAPVAATSSTPSRPASSATTEPLSASPTPAASGSRACVLFLYGHDARLQVTSTGLADPATECSSLATSLSSGGDFWTSQVVTTSDATAVVCAMQRDPWVIVVRDGGGQSFGQGLCSQMLQAGWAEDPQAEEQARAQDGAAAQASAQASAEAAAVSSAQDAVSTLQTQNAAFTNTSKVRADAQTADTDLAKERQDAKAGNGDNCYNVQSVVGYDAQSVVGYDVTTSASYDVNQEADAIQAARSDVSAVQQDEATLKADGLPETPGAAAATSEAESQTAEAIATTNKAIDDLNADLTTAYSIANTLGTGDCAGDGPGTPPGGLSHLS